MARPKKADDKPKDSGTHQISLDDFLRTRNSVVTGLASLQSAVSDLSRAYIAHTDTIIGKGNATTLAQLNEQHQLNISIPLVSDNSLFGGARGPTPAPTTEAPGEVKKRKRAPPDPNAPKRALTPFFLFLQTARPKIAEQMGPGKTAKEVQDEGGRRWREMTDQDKSEWQYKYAVNFARYKEQTKSYKAGLGIPEISDAEAKRIYDTSHKDGQLPKPVDLDPGHEQEEADDSGSTSSSSSSSDEESPEPVKAPPPKRSRATKDAAEKKLTAKSTSVKEPEPAAAETSAKVPERKKKKGGKKNEIAEKEVTPEPPSSPPKAAVPESQQKSKKGKGKKRKSEA